jgi:hypothetical protein
MVLAVKKDMPKKEMNGVSIEADSNPLNSLWVEATKIKQAYKSHCNPQKNL